jgi:hypothetical protein
MSDYAAAAAKVLRQAGLAVEHNEVFDVIKVRVNGFDNYAEIPDISHYGDVLTGHSIHEYYKLVIVQLQFDHSKIYTIRFNRDILKIGSKTYIRKREDDVHIGHLKDNEYYDYQDKWFHAIQENCSLSASHVEKLYSGGNVLNNNYTPALAIEVDILNTGTKQVVYSYNNFHTRHFTLFNIRHLSQISGDIRHLPQISGNHRYLSQIMINSYYLVRGHYKESKRPDLFRCVDDDNNTFAILLDGQDNLILASGTYIVPLINIDNCAVEPDENGLYHGYKVDTKYKAVRIYCYDDIFFSCCMVTNPRFVELEARKPGSGSRTKPAY